MLEVKLKQRYQSDIVPAMREEFGYDNVNEVPRLEKIVVNIGLGEALQNAKALDAATGDLAIITGQRPVVTKAQVDRRLQAARGELDRREGDAARCADVRVFDRLTNIALPRQRDFRGVSPDAFDGRGNYSLGLREQLIWPEIDYDKIDRVRGWKLRS